MIDQPPNRAGEQLPALQRVGRRQWLLMVAVVVASLVADLISKHLAFAHIAPAPVIVQREDVLTQLRQGERTLQMLIPGHQPLVVIPDVLNLTLVLNPGAVFGIGAGQRWFFIVFTALAIGLGVYMFTRWTTARDRWAHVALGLLIGGGLGNLYDRIFYGCVRDFIAPLPGVKFPFGWSPFGGNGAVWPYVSNVADALLIVGIGILAVFLWRKEGGRGSPNG